MRRGQFGYPGQRRSRCLRQPAEPSTAPIVCRRCYIHPLVLTAWQDGRLAAEVEAIRRRYRRTPRGLDRCEHVTLRWLEFATAAPPPD